MTIRDAQKYVKRYIDKTFVVQNINNSTDCSEIIKELEEIIPIYNKDRECRIFYEVDEEGVMSFTSVEILDKYSTEYDTENYNYVHTTLNKALKVFKLQNKKSTHD